MSKKIPSVAIIGGAATGTLAALHLYEQMGSDVSLNIFEIKNSLAEGRAYATHHSSHLLNVPADKMSYSEAKSSDFVDWLKQKAPELFQSKHYPFVPRLYFREYLKSKLQEAQSIWGPLIWHKEKVNKIKISNGKWRLYTDQNSIRDFDYCIVCTGYSDEIEASAAKAVDNQSLERISHIYRSTDVDKVQPHHEVFILGAGLSAMDLWRQLRSNGHKGKITFASRRGLFPLSHEPASQKQSRRLPSFEGYAPRQILQVLRLIQGRNSWGWIEIADQLRLQIMQIWSAWSHKEKAQFLRHLKPYWELIRHRTPPSIHAELQKEISQSTVQILRGKVLKTEAVNSDTLGITLQSKDLIKKIETQHFFLGTGVQIENKYLKIDVPWKGIEKCSFGLGTRNIGAPNLWFMGPASKTVYWEITAIPDIRKQASLVSLEIKGNKNIGVEINLWGQMRRHPHDVGESYLIHFGHALYFSLTLLKKAYFSFIHALLPFFYDDQVSNDLRDLGKFLVRRRTRTLHINELRCAPSLDTESSDKKAA